MNSGILLPLLGCAAAGVLIAAIYWPGLAGFFIFDDFPNVVDNLAVQITNFSAETFTSAATAYDGNIGRPVATLTIALDHFFFGLDPAAFKRTNLFIHIVCSLLVFALTMRLLNLAKVPLNPRLLYLLSLGTGLIWALHPLQVSTVLYVVQRMEMLAVLFSLASLIFYCNARQTQLGNTGKAWPRLMAAGACALIATLCKENGILIFGYWLALEVTFFRFGGTDQRTRLLMRWFFLLGMAAALALFIAIVLPNLFNSSPFSNREFTAWERLLTQMRVLPMYLSWYIYPDADRFLFYYDHFRWSTGFLSPVTTLLGFVFLVALAITAWIVRFKQPLVSLGIFWFFVAHAMTSNAISLELVFEHRNYFSLLGFLIAILGIVSAVGKRITPQLGITIALVLITGLGLLTHLQARTWGDRINLTMHLGHINPQSARAQLDRGILYGAMAGNDADTFFYQSGVTRLEKAARLPSATILPEQALIVLAALSGGDIQRHWWDSLHHKLETQPVSSEMRAGITGLLKSAESIPPDHFPDLTRAVETVLGRGGCNAQVTMLYGFFLLEVVGQPAHAKKAFEAALRTNRGVRLWPEAAARLEQGGFPELVNLTPRPDACSILLSQREARSGNEQVFFEYQSRDQGAGLAE